MHKSNYTLLNSQVVDCWNEAGWEWSIPVNREEYAAAQNGCWSVLLTPTRPVPQAWFTPLLRDGRLDGVKLLGLASGGGQQMPIFAALGAYCTVLDYSARQLAHEMMVAEREGYIMNIVQADITKRLPFDDASFDMIFHPVSNCYVADVYHVWNECYRVLKKGGLLLAGMDNGINFMFGDAEEEPLIAKYKLPYNPLTNAALYEQALRQGCGIQFSHTLEEQIGGQLQAGFTLTDVYEDRNKEGLVREYCPQYWATRALKA